MRKNSFCLPVTLLLCMSLLFHEFFPKASGKTICGPLYPRVLGGSTGWTYLESMDQYDHVTVVGGYSFDIALNWVSSTPTHGVGYIA